MTGIKDNPEVLSLGNWGKSEIRARRKVVKKDSKLVFGILNET